jgi:hypothetical protein
MLNHLRLEEKLILHCARTRIEPERAEPIRALAQQSPDWERLVQTATLHRVLPLVYRSLEAVCPDLVPEPVMAHLHDYFQQNTFNTLRLTAELRQLLALFETQGIPVVPYKGPTLLALAYDNLPLRVITDLDIVLRERDLDRAGQMLLAHGFRRREDEPRNPADEAAFRRYSYHSAYINQASGIQVELHWRFMRDPRLFRMKDGALWERLQPLQLGGVKTVTFPPEDMLLLLCGHGAKHFWPELMLVCDVAALITCHPRMDWDQVAQRAERYHAKRFLRLGILLCSRLLETPIPDPVLREAQADRAARSLSDEICAAFFVDKAERRISESGWVRREIKLRQRWQDKMSYIFLHAFDWAPNQTDRQMLRLPRPLFFLYRFLRPLRLAWRYGWAVLKEAVRR